MQVFNKENTEGKLLVLMGKFAKKNRQLSFELPTRQWDIRIRALPTPPYGYYYYIQTLLLKFTDFIV